MGALTADDLAWFVGILFTCYIAGFAAGGIHRSFIQLGDKL